MAASDTCGGVTGGESIPDVSRDLVFDALKNSRRRLVLRHLHERAEAVTVNDLVEHVAAVENDTTPAELTSDQRKRVYVGLYQSHLPRLDDMEFVEFDQSDGAVELGPAGPVLETYLYVDEDERLWYRDDLLFVAVAATILTLELAVGLIEGLGAVVAFAGIVVGVAGLAAHRTYSEDE